MALLGGRSRSRGSIAVEFALVTPIFIALVGAVFYLGLALYTRLLILNAANTAVRNCVIKQVSFGLDGEFTSCATQEFNALTGPSGNFAIVCNGGAPLTEASSQPASSGRLSGSVKVLSLKVGCDVTMGSMMWMSGTGAETGKVRLQINTAMPYSLSRLSN